MKKSPSKRKSFGNERSLKFAKKKVDHESAAYSVPEFKVLLKNSASIFKGNYVTVLIYITINPAGEPSTSPRFPRGFMGEFQGIIPVEISS